MKRLIYLLLILPIVTACSDYDRGDTEPEIADAGDIIKVGGLTTSPLEISVSENATTRAQQVQDAETVPWLIRPLKEGLDITYGKVSSTASERNERVAILKLTGGTLDDNVYNKDEVTNWAIYTFQYKGTDPAQDAIWYGNGEHYFEGMFVPNNLRYGAGLDDASRLTQESVNTTSAPNITTDQSATATNYSYLGHYLAMPANTRIHATIGRVKLPFYHRLSRVIAYILIDPDMTTDPAHPVTLKGYKKDAEGNPTDTEDPTTTSLRFCNVDILKGVKDLPPSGEQLTHELTPQWGAIRKVIPHFEAEEGSMVQNATGNFEEKDPNFYMFYDDNTQEYIFPTMENWITYYNQYKDATPEQLKAAKVTRTNYGKVPVYDLIARPTYTDVNKVMYDERNADGNELSTTEKEDLVTYKNKIDFEMTLSNGLIYTKEFPFDLNANEQTVVYLRISRESVDYNASGSEVWIKKEGTDDWYGIDNQGGHSLSKAGSTWQRAYTYNATVSSDKVTDGGFYNETTTGEDGTVGQYVTKDTWIKKFAQAYEGGECHGDYFILTSDIEIDAKLLPDNFVFTGHLDAHGKTIKIINTGTNWTEYVATTDYTINPLYKDQSGTVYTLPTLYTKVHHDANYDNDTEFEIINGVTYLKNTLKYVPEVSHLATQEDVDAGKANNIGDKVIDTPAHYEVNDDSVVKQDAYDEYLEAAGLTIATMMTSGVTYYERSEASEPYTYTEYTKPTTLFKKVDHTSGSALFAGLDGAYNAAEGVANVHKENNVMVPYTDGTTGWRAEVMNLVVDGKLFVDDVYTLDAENHRTGYNTTTRKVSGNVQNCKDSEGKVPNHTPALFKY